MHPVSARSSVRRAVVIFAVLWGLSAALFLHQWRWASTKLDPGIWTVRAASEAPLFTDELIPKIAAQILRAGRVHLEFFLRLVTAHPETQMRGLRARLFVPGHAWADLIFHDAEGRRCAFRLSRSPGVPSGFLRWGDDGLETRHDVTLGEGVVVPEAAITPERRQELMIWSYNQAHAAFRALEREGLGRWFTVEVRSDPGGLAARVDGASAGQWRDGPTEIRGPAGVRAGDLPCIYVDWAEMLGAQGEVLWRDDFAPSAEVTYRILGVQFFQFGFLVFLFVALIWLAPAVFPGIEREALALGLARGLLPLVAVPLFGWWWGPVERRWHLANWWAVALCSSMVLWLGVFVAHRRLFRWRAGPLGDSGLRAAMSARLFEAPGGAWGPRLPDLLVAAVLLTALPLISFVWGDRQSAAEVAAGRFRQVVIPGTRVLSEGAHVVASRPSGRTGARLSARVRLLAPETRVELYLLEAERGFFAPEQGVRDWYALRLSDDSAACGLVVSDQPPRQPGLRPLAVGEEVQVEFAVEGSRLVARLGPPGAEALAVWDRVRDDRFQSGHAGLVVRAGRAEVADLTFEGLSPTVAASGHLAGRVQAWARRSLSQFLCLALGAVLLLWFAGALGLAVAGRLAVQPLLLLSGAAWLVAVAAGGALGVHLWRHESLLRAGWSPWFGLWAGLLTAAGLHYIVWLGHFGTARRFHLISLGFLALLVALGEQALRATPLDFALQSRRVPGHVRNLFVFGSWEAERLWMTYTGAHEFPHRGLPGWDEHVPLKKPADEVRVFCMGGSSTWGAGISRVEDSYPWQLERILRARHPRVNVINAGYPGYTVFHDLLALRRDVLRLAPDVITLYVGANDGYLSWWTGGPVEEAWEWVVAQTGAGPLGRLALWLPRQRLFVGLTRALDALRPFPARLHVQVPPERFEANLRAIAALCRERGVGLVLAHEVMVEDLHLAHPSHAAYHEILDRVGRELDLPVVDPRPLFREHLDDGWLVDPVHPSPAANRALAELLAPAVQSLLASPEH